MQSIEKLMDKRSKKGKKDRKRKKASRTGGKISHKVIKSPSADTMYSPLVNKIRDGNLDNISAGIEQIRLQANNSNASELPEGKRRSRSRSRSRKHKYKKKSKAKRHRTRSGGKSDDDVDDGGSAGTSHEALRQEAEDYVIQSERFKADAVKPPEGKVQITEKYDYSLDDEFLHTTCHVEEPFLVKIAKGGFVELVKLRHKVLKKVWINDKPRLELVNKDGKPYFVDAEDKDTQITNIKAWEEAFRVYIMLYTKANPERTSDILQYLDTIISAAHSFIWENVAQYDYAFRKLMEKHPNRSWARTHSQMWSFFMRDHVSQSRGQGASGSARKDWREICCWRYNKRHCSKTAQECKFEHRCSVCGSYSHIYLTCPKRSRRRSSEKKGDDKVRKERNAD